MTSNTGEQEGLYSTPSKFLWRRNLLLVARYLLKFTCCSLHVVKSPITHCKSFVTCCRICSLQKIAGYSLQIARYLLQKLLIGKNQLLLVAEVARCKRSHVTHCKIHSLLVAEAARCKKSLTTCCKIRSLLVAEVARCKKPFVIRCKIPSLLVAEVAGCKKSLFTCCRSWSLQKLTRYLLQNWLITRCKISLTTRCKIRFLLVGEVARCEKSFGTRSKILLLLVPKIHSLRVAKFCYCKKSLVNRCKIGLLLAATNHLLIIGKNHSSLAKTITSPQSCGREMSYPTPSTFLWRRNFLLVAPYSLKFTRCSLLVVKSFITRCKIRSSLVAEVARCKICLLLVAKNHLLLVAEVARGKKSLVTCCKICMLLLGKIHSLCVAKFTRCKKSLLTRCKIRLLLAATNHLLLNAKNHSSPIEKITST